MTGYPTDFPYTSYPVFTKPDIRTSSGRHYPAEPNIYPHKHVDRQGVVEYLLEVFQGLWGDCFQRDGE